MKIVCQMKGLYKLSQSILSTRNKPNELTDLALFLAYKMNELAELNYSALIFR